MMKHDEKLSNMSHEVQLVEVVRELDSLEVSVRLQPHLPIHRFQDDEAPLVEGQVDSGGFRQELPCSNFIS